MRKGIVLTITATVVFAIISPEFSRAQTNARGNYNTQVPIEVPPFHGITPVVKLVYQSSGGAGLAGAGWDLLAGSVISRRSATNGTPLFAPNDLFVLDGEELVPCKQGSTSPSCTTAVTAFGSSTGFYSTRIESFERIRFDASTETWTVWGRDGTRRAYASGDGGLSYQLLGVTDTFNNQVNYIWGCAPSGAGPCQLDAIAYDVRKRPVALPGVRISFYREGRSDPRGIATGRGRAWLGERLRSIVVYSHGQLLRAYRLKYSTSLVSGASIMTSVQQYGRDATADATGEITAGVAAPLPPITFNTNSLIGGAAWQLNSETTQPGVFHVGAGTASKPVYGLPYTDLTVAVGGVDPNARPNGTVVGDFDGDGRVEVMAWGLNFDCSKLSVSGYLSAPVGLGPAVPGTVDTGVKVRNPLQQQCKAQAFTADRNGDLNDDIVVAVNLIDNNRGAAKGNLITATYRAKLTNSPSGGFISGGRQNNIWDSSNRNCVVADVTGDGRDDLICEDPNARVIRTYPAGGPTTVVATNSASAPSFPNHDKLRIAAGDVDGNGLADIVLVIPVGTTTHVILGRSIGGGAYDWSEEQSFAVDMQQKDDAFHLTDLDGDGRLDLAFTREQASSIDSTKIITNINYALSRKGYGGGRWRLQIALTSDLIGVSFVDLDGDGRADLLGEGLRVQLANPMGGFRQAGPVQAACASGNDDSTLLAADLNGDGLADPMCIQNVGDGEFRLVDRPSQPQGTDRHRWRRADVDGDGGLELVYIAFSNPGYQIYVVSTQTQNRTLFTLSQGPQTGPLVEPDAARWVFADVGSAAGPADGKDDLVLIEQSGGAIQVTTLLSTGLGTFNVYRQTVWPNYPDRSTLGWFSAQLDRDGRSELVHLRPSLPTGVVVDVLRPTGPGQWTTTSQTYFASGAAPMIDRSVRRFLAADVNRDRLTDLIHVETTLGVSDKIRTLRADGQGSFTEVVSTIPTVSVLSRLWRLGDLDGDGVPDLVFVSHTISGSTVCLTISQITGDGLGGFVPSSVAGIGGDICVDTGNPLYTRLFEDASNVVLCDLDGDGDDEIVHTTHVIDAIGELRLMVTRITYDPNGATPALRWSAVPEVIQLEFDHGDAWAWIGHRDPVTGAAGLAYVHSELAMTLSWRGPTDEMTSIKNGIGLTTTINYGPYLNSRVYLPSGYVPRVVTQVATLDEAYNPPVRDAVEYGYNDARWSDHDGALAGFDVKVASDSRARYYTRFAIDDMCGSRVTQTETRTPNGAEKWGSANIHYVTPGTDAPFRCMPDVTERYECEPGQPCRAAERVEQDYDTYGNVIDERSIVDRAAPTRVSTTVKMNPTVYIVDRAAIRATTGWTGTAWKPMAMRFFYYDDQSDFRLPPSAHGALTKVADMDDQGGTLKVTSYTYAPNGVLTQTMTPGGKTSTSELDPTYGRFPIRLCDAMNCLTQEWDLALGKVTRLTDAAGGVRVTTYDAFGRVIQVDHPGGGFTRTSYLANGVFTVPIANRQRVRTEVSDGSPVDGVLWNESFFDGGGRAYRTTREGGATVTTTYSDASARPDAVSLVHNAAAVPTQWTRFAYDGQGRSLSVTRPDGAIATISYALGQIESRDEMGVATVRRFDGAGRVLELVEPTQAVTRYAYDPLGRLVTITNAFGNQDTFTWSTLGRRVASSDPDRGNRTFRYFDDGELAEQVDAKGQRIAWTYDTIGRVIRREDRDTSGTVTRTINWTYDDGANPHGSSRGRLVRVDDSQPGTSTTFSREFWYDAGGRVTRERTCIDGTCMSQDTEYDLAGRVSAHIYPDTFGNTQTPGAERLTYNYDVAGRIALVGRYAYLGWQLDDRLDKINYGNGVKTKFEYDANRRWLDSIGIQDPSGGQLQRFEYLHDPVGRIKRQTATGTQTVTLGYTYDNLGRLRKVQSSDPTRAEEFVYDTIGRLTWSPVLGDVHYDDPAHIHAATKTDRGSTRSYDVNGNAQTMRDPSGRNLAMEWTVDDRIKQVKYDLGQGVAYTFGYAPEGQRVKKVGPSGTLRLFGPRLALNEQGWMVKYYMAGDLLLAGIDSTLSYFHTDVAHATRLITDQNGLKIADYQYTAFGESVAGGAMPDNEIGFSGARRDTELGLVAMGARTYDPVLGQFLSADSYIPNAYRPQSLNRYSYVENDPINQWDPSGHSKMEVEYRKERQEFWANYERQKREANQRLFDVFGSYLSQSGLQSALWYGYNKAGEFVLHTNDSRLMLLFRPPPNSDSLAKETGAVTDGGEGGGDSKPLGPIGNSEGWGGWLPWPTQDQPQKVPATLGPVDNSEGYGGWLPWPTQDQPQQGEEANTVTDEIMERGVAAMGPRGGPIPPADQLQGLSLGPGPLPFFKGRWTSMAFQAAYLGWKVTGANEQKGHNVGSAHYSGFAIDIRTRGKSEQENQDVMRFFQEQGFKVNDERIRPPGQKVWGGPHIHIECRSPYRCG